VHTHTGIILHVMEDPAKRLNIDSLLITVKGERERGEQ
jgi:hypothetical protein